MKSNVAVKKCLLILITVLFIMAFGALFVACAPKGSEDSNDHEHLYRNYTYNNDATCGRDGTETATCEFCTKTDTRPSVAHPATGNHTYNTNNVCTVCGHIKSSGDNNDDTKKYKTVTFDAGDGDVSVSEKQFEVGKVMADLPVPTREGYRFVCWYNPIHGEFTSASIMPNVDFTVIAQWEKVITQYEDDYVLFKPATQGVKSAIIYDLYHSDVDKFVYVELTSDDIGGVASVGTENNFTLRTLESMQYSIKSGYNWAWYQGNFNNPNGAQRFTLRYGSNVQFVTISDGSGVVVQTYLVDIYVRRDYYVSLYKNIFEDQPYDKVRVIENDRFPSSTATASEGDFEFDKRVYYNSSTRAYESFVYSTAITQNWNLYQTYKPVTLNATLNGGSVNGALTVTPYEKYFELPTATKDGYDFMGWKLSDGKYLTDINGFGGDKYYSKDTAVLSISAEFARTKFYYTFENDELRTQKTVPVVTYTDNTNSEIAEILHVLQNDDGSSINVTADKLKDVGDEFTVEARNRNGYTWGGWYDGNRELTKELSYTVTISNENKTYTAKWTLNDEMKNFEFSSTATSCSITGIKDKTVTEISVPEYVNEISQGAFSDCSSLTSITLPFVGGRIKTSSDTYQYPFGYIFGTSSYTGGTATKQYYYGSSTSSETHDTYYIPTSLKSVTITGGNILHNAFYGCSNLTSITIPNSVTSIGDDAFYGCSSLTSIKIPNSVTRIGQWAFYGCGSLTSVTIPNGVTIIWHNAFRNCSNLTSITISDSVTEIGQWAFQDCSNLSSITIPDSVTEIGSKAFYGCSSLTSITVQSGNTKYHSSGNCIIETATNTLIVGCKNSVIPADGSVTSIDGAFSGCSGLINIEIPNSVTSIGWYAFQDCINLTSIAIPNGVTSIGDSAFSNCSSLASITIPNSVTSIGWYAFQDCINLTSITIPNSVTSIGSYAFYGCSKLTIYCEAQYKPSGWNSNWNPSNRPVVWDCKNK